MRGTRDAATMAAWAHGQTAATLRACRDEAAREDAELGRRGLA